MREELYHLVSLDAKQGIQFGLAGLFQAWVERKSWEEWIVKAGEIIRQVEQERGCESRWFPVWEEHLGHILQHTPKSEGILTQLGEDDTLDSSARTGAYVNLGVLLKNLHRPEEAEAAYRQAITLNPEDATAYYNLGVLLKNLHRSEEAEAAYRQAIALNPEYASVYSNLGVLLADLHRHEEAEAAYRQAIALNPEYARAYYNLACLYALQKEVDHAIDSLQQAIQLDAKYRNMARTDNDFDGIREDPSFQGLLDHDDFT
jgi:Flp pilus assembly protein TadD